MKKIILIMIMTILFIDVVNANPKTEFLEQLVKMTSGKVDDVVKQIPKVSKNIKRSLSKNIDIPKLSNKIKKDPQKVFLANKADEIMSKGDFEKMFFANQSYDNQMAMIVQSSKYGDEYFDIARTVSKISPRELENIKIIPYKIPVRELTKKNLQTKFIETLSKSGKYGWERLKEIGSFAKKYPKSSAASGAFVWWLTDEKGFNEAVASSGKSVVEFLMSTTGSALTGTGEAISEHVSEVIDNSINDFKVQAAKTINDTVPYTVKSIVGLLFFVFLFIVWRKRNIIHEFITRADKVKKKDTGDDNEDEF